MQAACRSPASGCSLLSQFHMIQITTEKVPCLRDVWGDKNIQDPANVNCSVSVTLYNIVCAVFSSVKPDCALCHVSLQKLWSKPQCSQNLSVSFQADYSTTPTTMTQNVSVMLNCFWTVLHNELSMCRTPCDTMSDCTLRPKPGRRWSDTVSCLSSQACIVRTYCYWPLSILTISTLVMSLMNLHTKWFRPWCSKGMYENYLVGKMRREKVIDFDFFVCWREGGLNCLWSAGKAIFFCFPTHDWYFMSAFSCKI